MNDNQIPVTKDVLKAFGDKAKQMFKRQPFIIDTDNQGSVISIETSLPYGQLGPDDLNLEITGLTTDSLENYAIKSSIIFHAGGSLLDSGHVANAGSDRVKCVALVKDSDDREGLITIHVVFTSSVEEGVLDLISIKSEVLSSNETISAAYVTSLSHIQEETPSSYIQLYDSSDDKIYDGESAGEIISTASFDPSFIIRETDSVTKQYPAYTEFNKIQHSDDTKKLDHDLIFEYDYNTVLPDGSQTTVGNLGTRLRVPLPEILSNGVTGNFYSVNVSRGVVVGGSNSINIPAASVINVGGIKLGDDTTYARGEKVWVQLDSDKRAFVDMDSQDIHRGDLASAKYSDPDNIGNYEGKIFQHIGSTTDDFVEGYFYKCVKSGYSVSREDAGTPYTIDSQAGLKLEQLIIDKGWPLIPNSGFTVYVDQSDYDALASETENIGTEQNPEVVHTKTFNDLDTFKIKNTGSDTSYTLTKAELLSGVGISISPEWQDSLLFNYTYDIAQITFEVTASSFRWRQWNVQPRGGEESCGCERITEEEIEALFHTYVNYIEINEGDITINPGDVESLSVTVGPEEAEDKTITWVSSNPEVATVMPIGNTLQANVFGGVAGVTTITASAVAHPLEEPQYAQITVTVQENLNEVV